MTFASNRSLAVDRQGLSDRAERAGPATRLPGVPVPAIEMLSAEKVFPDGTRGLAPIDLTVGEGEFVSLIGPSGCGKSTLLSLVANLEEPSDGRLLWWRRGFDAVGGEGRKLSVVFQDATLMPWLRIASNVRLPLDLAHVSRGEAAPRVQAALDLVGLGAQGRKYPRQLSGGMRMRVSIARAVATNPDLLLMDEPFAALDEITRAALNDDLLRLWRTQGLTIVFVTHSVYESVYLSSRILVMAPRPGRVVADLTLAPPPDRDEGYRTTPDYTRDCRAVSDALRAARLG